MRRNIIIIDTGAVLHATKHAFKKNMLSNNEKHTFIIYGFLLKLRSILARNRYDILVFAFDDKTENSYRRELYNKYKEKRKAQHKTEEQIQLDKISYPQFDEIENFVLPTIGFRNRIKFQKLEADDVIAKICKKYKNDDILIISNDGDLYQLLSMHVKMMNPQNHAIYGIKEFRKDYNMEPRMWKRVKVYGGCTSDNVPGIPVPDHDRKIASKGAINFVHRKVLPHHKAYKAFIAPENKNIISRNKSLVILPHRKSPDVTLLPETNLRKEGLIKVAKEYNFNSILSDLNEYCKVFRLR